MCHVPDRVPTKPPGPHEGFWRLLEFWGANVYAKTSGEEFVLRCDLLVDHFLTPSDTLFIFRSSKLIEQSLSGVRRFHSK